MSEGAPKTNKTLKGIDGLDFLYREEKLSREEWVKLIEYQITTLKPYFKKFTMPTLGDLKIARQCDNIYEINAENWKYSPIKTKDVMHPITSKKPAILTRDKNGQFCSLVGNQAFSLKNQGFFYEYYKLHNGEDLPEERKFWGILRSGMVIVGVALVEPYYQKRMNYKEKKTERYLSSECIRQIQIREVDVSDIFDFMEVEPFSIFSSMKSSVSKWVKNAHKRLEEVHFLEKKMGSVSDIVARICGYGAYVLS